ncbi:MAG: hypothetical protein K8T20_08040 [Planctomycetes bacterium]|nr:hypothetical protein [Planctomycetota bacterium]
MKRFFPVLAVFLSACAGTSTEPDYDAARQMIPKGPRADEIRERFHVSLYGSWEDGELSVVLGAMEMFPNKDLSGLEFYRMPRGEERGGRYDLGRVTVREPTLDIVLHELGHAVHSRCPSRAKLDAQLQAALGFAAYCSASSWSDGAGGPRRGFVSPYAAMNVEECVAESVAAAKLWSRRGRGPLGEADRSDERFALVFEILDAHGLTDDEDREEIRKIGLSSPQR